MEEWMTLKEGAQYLRMSEAGLRNYIKTGKLTSYRQGRNIRLKRSDLNSLLTHSRSQPPERDSRPR